MQISGSIHNVGYNTDNLDSFIGLPFVLEGQDIGTVVAASLVPENHKYLNVTIDIFPSKETLVRNMIEFYKDLLIKEN